MKKLIIGLTLAMLLMLAEAEPASAAIHPIVQSDCASSTVGDTPADTENPPGQSGNPSTEAEGGPNDVTHPWQNSPVSGLGGEARSGEGEANCTNPGDE